MYVVLTKGPNMKAPIVSRKATLQEAREHMTKMPENYCVRVTEKATKRTVLVSYPIHTQEE